MLCNAKSAFRPNSTPETCLLQHLCKGKLPTIKKINFDPLPKLVRRGPEGIVLYFEDNKGRSGF